MKWNTCHCLVALAYKIAAIKHRQFSKKKQCFEEGEQKNT